MKNRSKIPGKIDTIDAILNINNGPFLSDIIPNIGPTIINNYFNFIQLKLYNLKIYSSSLCYS